MKQVIASLMFVAFLSEGALAAAEPETIEIPYGEETLKGVLFRPDVDGPAPAVVALHGCGGLGGPSRALSERHRQWGELLAASGFAVLFPDSFGSRGLGPQCREPEAAIRASRERVADAYAARRWLQEQSWIRADRVSLLGWSKGGTTALWAVRTRAGLRDDGPDFRSVVALYPGCRRLAESGWTARIPTLVLVGSADDWNPARACAQMVAEARGRSARATIVTYPGALHGFDHPELMVRERRGLAYSADGSGRAHVGTHPLARADALKRVPEWLAR